MAHTAHPNLPEIHSDLWKLNRLHTRTTASKTALLRCVIKKRELDYRLLQQIGNSLADFAQGKGFFQTPIGHMRQKFAHHR